MLRIKQSGENFILFEQGNLREPLRILDICEIQEIHSELAYNMEIYEDWKKKEDMQPCPLYVDPLKNCQALKDRDLELKRTK